MSRFTSHGGFVFNSKLSEWLVVEPVVFHVGHADSGIVIKLTKGHTTDFASVPFWVRPFLPDKWIFTKASALHDDLYRHGLWSKYFADFVFFEAMIVEKIPKPVAFIMYLAVMFGGHKAYRTGVHYSEEEK